MELRRASEFSIAELTRFWNLAYTGYFVNITFTEAMMANWFRCGDFDLDRSLILMDGAAPVGISFLGVRGDRGWIGGYGISPDYRGRGLGYSLFADHMALIREDGPPAVQLEVLTQNWARKVYERAGFVTTRRLAMVQGKPVATEGGVLSEAEPRAVLAHHARLHAMAPAPWQHEAEWLVKALPDTARAFYTGPASAPTGFVIATFGPEAVRIQGAAASGDEAAGSLVAGLASMFPGYTITVVNEPVDSPIYAAMRAAGCAEVLDQFEMHWRRS